MIWLVTQKGQKKEKKQQLLLKTALVDSDGYSIPKLKIGRSNLINAFSLDYTPDNKPAKVQSKDIPLRNQFEPIVNSTVIVSSTFTSSHSTPVITNGTASTGDDGLSTLMSEVYNVLDGQDSESGLNLSVSNGEPSAQEFLEMREIQGLYDDEMAYSHLASAFEIPQIKPGGTSLPNPFHTDTSSLMMSTSQVPTYMGSSYLDAKSSSKMTPVDSLNSLSHNLESILSKPSNSCMMENSLNPYLSNSSANPYLMNSIPSQSSLNNSLPNHNMTGSAFTSTSQKSSVSSGHISGASFLLSGGSSSSGLASPSSTLSPHKTAPSPALSPHISSPTISPQVNPSTISPQVNPPAISPHVNSPAMSPHVNSPAMSPHMNTPAMSPHSAPLPEKKKSGLNIVPTEKLLDSSKSNQLINNQLVNNQLVNNNPLMSNQLASSSPAMSSYYPDSSMSAGYSSYYNPMYSYMGQISSYSNQQYMSSSSSMAPYFSNNFYTASSNQPIEDSQYKRKATGPSLESSLGLSNIPSGPGGPPFKRLDDPEFKKPIEPPCKQPKIVPKKLSSLLEKDDKKYPPGSRNPSAPISIQRPSALHSLSRTPNSPLQLRGVRPPPLPPPLLNSGPPPSALSMGPLKPNSAVSSTNAESPATSALKKRGITISSVTKPAVRKLTSSVNITPVVKKPGTGPDRVGQIGTVPKLGGPPRPVELLKDAECNLGIPVVDLSNPSVLSNLNSMGITSFIPVNQMRGSNQIFALPIINTGQKPRRLDDLGASGVLSLGSVYKLK